MNKIEILFDPKLLIEDDTVKLRIVSLDDIQQLKKIAFEPSLWKYFTTELNNEEELVKYVENCIADFYHKKVVPFVIIDKKNASLAGMSSFGNIFITDGRIEIGWSWLGKDYQGTGINAAYKKLLLSFAFDKLGFERVEFKTDVLNQKARKALLKIGATEEGILRSHTLMPHNRRRDTIYYSILKDEWLKQNSKNG